MAKRTTKTKENKKAAKKQVKKAPEKAAKKTPVPRKPRVKKVVEPEAPSTLKTIEAPLGVVEKPKQDVRQDSFFTNIQPTPLPARPASTYVKKQTLWDNIVENWRDFWNSL